MRIMIAALLVVALGNAPARAAEAVDDVTPPAVGIHEPLAGAVLTHVYPSLNGPAGTAPGDEATVTLELFAGDAATGTPHRTAQAAVHSGGGWGTISLHVPDGHWTLRVSQKDAAGNTGAATVRFRMDTQFPYATVSTPHAGAVLEDVRPTIAGQASTGEGDEPAVTVRLFAEQPPAGEALHTWEAAVIDGGWTATPQTALADGFYTLAVTQADDAGHQTVQHSGFAVDTAAPALTVDSPGTDTSSPAASGSAGTAAGDDARVKVEVFAGPAAVGQPLKASNASVSAGRWTSSAATGLTDGTYTLRATQSDHAGRVSTATRTFRLDREGPAVAIHAPAEGATVDTLRPTISGTAGTAAGDAATVTVTVADADLIAHVADGRWSVTVPSDLQPGLVYTASVAQRDAVGNVAADQRRFAVGGAPASAPPPPSRDTRAPAVELPRRVALRGGRVVLTLFIDEPATATLSLRAGRRVLATGRVARGGHLTVRLKPRRAALARLRRVRRGLTLHVRAADQAGNVTTRTARVRVGPR